ncbi:MAG TPA: DUF1206 domain-containing protein [Mycobacteriales bacterium]
MTTGTQAVRQAAASPWPERLARLGLAARGVLYIVIGILAVRIAFGQGGARANQSGALREVAAQPFGRALVWVIAVGLVGYALWRLLTALLGRSADPAATGAKERVKALAEGIGYGSVAVLALKVALGSSSSGSSGSGSQKAATVLSWTGGQFLVGAVGVLIAGVGLYLAVEGWRADFTKELNLFRVGPTARRIVIQLGRFGRIARGAAFVLIGILVVVAAVTYDPSKAQGLDGALRTLAQQPFGSWLLAAVAVGFVAFGCYGLAESRLRRIG